MYRVRPGDTLSGISLKFYGTALQWRKIYKANPAIRQNANKLRVGQSLYIPK
jgi:nucleoid-associated protein YgaU